MTDTIDDKKKSYPYHRRSVRYQVRLRVKVSTLEDYDTWTENLSKDGTCFVIPGQIKEGQSVDVSITLRSKQPGDQIRCKGKIVWNEKCERGHRHGGQFISFEGNDQARLKEYLIKF